MGRQLVSPSARTSSGFHVPTAAAVRETKPAGPWWRVPLCIGLTVCALAAAGAHAAPPPTAIQSELQTLEAEARANPDAALEKLNQALSAPGADREPRILAQLYRLRAEILRERGQWAAARRDAQEFSLRANALGELPLQATALLLAGSIEAEDGKIADALSQFHEARTLLEGSPHQKELLRVYNAIGVAYTFLLDHTSARGHYEKALHLTRVIGDRDGEIRALGNLALSVSETEGAAAGLVLHREALALALAAGDAHGQALQLGNICQRLQQVGKLDEARATCEDALERLQALNFSRPRAGVRMTLGDIERAAGRLDAALAHYQAALADSAGVVPGVEVPVRQSLSALREEMGDIAGALAELREWALVRTELSERERRTAVAELEVRYKVEQRERELKVLRLDAELADARLRRRTLMLWTVLVALGLSSLAAAVAWRGYRMEKRLEAALEARNRALEEALQKNSELARVDLLTGLMNRRAFEEQAGRVLAGARRIRQPVSLVLADLDHFKTVNDRHGHLRGDETLKQVAEVLRRTLRESDLACRWGGEEFLCLLVGSDPAAAAEVMERVRRELAGHPDLADLDPRITLTAGVAGVDDDLQAALHKADQALYAGKGAGRDRVVVHS